MTRKEGCSTICDNPKQSRQPLPWGLLISKSEIEPEAPGRLQDQLLGARSQALRTPLLGAPLVPGQALGAPHWERLVLRILEFPWAGGFRFRRPAGSTSRRRVPLQAGGFRFRPAARAPAFV